MVHSPPRRKLLLIFGLLLIILGLSALIFALWPLPGSIFNSVIPATVLAPP